MRFEISGRAIVGSKDPQQDSWRVFNGRGEDLTNGARTNAIATGDGTLVVVADGIGGYAGGEVASKLACDAFGKAFFESQGIVADRLNIALNAANTAIAEEKRRKPDLQDMGCTLIGVYLDQGKMTFVSIGDSLLLRSRDDEIHRVNVDHSYFEYLDRQVLGSSDPQRWSVAVRDTRRRASLTLAVTGGELASTEFGHRPQIAIRPMLVDDILIVASDGIETLDLVQLQNFMQHLRPAGAPGIADGLIRAVDGIGATRSYQDNTTIVIIGASESAGLTRVLPSSSTSVPIVSAPKFSLSSLGLPQISNTVLLVGAAAFGIVALVVLLLFGDVLSGDKTAQLRRETSSAADTDKAPAAPKNGTSRPSDADIFGPEPPKQNQAAVPATGRPPAGSSSDPRDPGQKPLDPSGEPSAGNNLASSDQTDFNKGGQQYINSQPLGLAFQGGRPLKMESANFVKCSKMCLIEPACAAFTVHIGMRCELFASQGKIVSEGDARSGVKEPHSD